MNINSSLNKRAAIIDIRVNHILNNGGNNADIIDSMGDNYKMYASVKAKATHKEMSYLFQTYSGFRYFSKLVNVRPKNRLKVVK